MGEKENIVSSSTQADQGSLNNNTRRTSRFVLNGFTRLECVLVVGCTGQDKFSSKIPRKVNTSTGNNTLKRLFEDKAYEGCQTPEPFRNDKGIYRQHKRQRKHK